ncbi:MAG: DUF2080 family transposase-associated protein [Candidatus Saccharicenans sp.]|uniref:DUF2080 family transposase-associated protein n=1 Tax=Candidatus Saccharicenans sp. TaxID=2819258 RepID=UPI00404B60B9
MKDEAELPMTVEVEKVEKVFIKKVKQIGNSTHIPFHKKFFGKEVLVMLPKGRVIYAKKAIKVK